ncbi:hypothetical protein BDU57DRAFT_517268 [Ampelomyces quisqualis]|uniref:N-acetyltransferase domain-containing protein n=1 Tax=Ampelomyces quisqualis TaxID=50730 RepID=A0A6A5QM75_AMPQU|nr:hypothetical protein BDU57DRAFT_517268 [Ampelomyces quisqualis]
MMPVPSINGVRLATLNDLHRISIVAAAAFFWSPTFRFQRPRYREFPADTVASYRTEYENAIQDPAFVVLVAEDILQPDEAEHVYEALRFACPSSCAGKKGIVGVCSFKLKPGSCYVSHLQPAGYNDLRCGPRSEYRKRDQCPEAVEIYEAVTSRPKSLHLANKMRLSTLAVLPMYWRRGHATRLVNFCTQLADLDEALLGISATPQGALVAAKVGFEECEIVRVKKMPRHEGQANGDPCDAADAVLWIGVRPPGSRPSSNGHASRSESPIS